MTVLPERSLATVLAEEINSFGQFCLLLEQEREALARLDQNLLDDLISRKQMLCEHLACLAEERQALTGPDAAAGLLRVAPELAGEWQRLLTLARQARELNQLNGTLIEARLQHNQNAMAILQLGDSMAATYDADGLSRAGGAARHLGKA